MLPSTGIVWNELQNLHFINKELLSDRIVDFKEGGIYLDTDGETKWVYLGHTGLYYGVDTEFVLTNGDMFIKYHELNNLRSKLVNALNSPDRKILVKDLFCYTDIPYLVREIGAIHVDNLDLFESFDHFTSTISCGVKYCSNCSTVMVFIRSKYPPNSANLSVFPYAVKSFMYLLLINRLSMLAICL